MFSMFRDVGSSAAGRAGIVCALVPAMLFGTAAAQFSQNSNAPIDITGAQFEAFQNEDYALWTGDVQVVQGEVILTAPELKIYGIGGGRFNRVDATGGIRYTNGVEAISGDQAIYRKENETIVVTGNVVVVQGRQVMTGERMTYFLDSGKIIFNNEASSRVRGVFFTEDQAPSN
ncbi:LptA/OstA family protein [Aquisalinus flavus]|uniref:Organic solvent tolerance-like N-terminal domain-containing protein n=1 Tax=Aquisalinus flavus TaxID=1526572 RepID=A0A8J2V5K7_9PROT|nr:LptA/OstA family protein [Aquisalinus flavus]MBD0425807.1 hypothetical protein [Aquisalinus flavus]UNE48587.1 hypothetical protein FF099_11285 [Aquisalinus flavus]GGD13076.1 hypothetical protein GCM10011342_22350 [Aquisalinus flavus]